MNRNQRRRKAKEDKLKKRQQRQQVSNQPKEETTEDEQSKKIQSLIKDVHNIFNYSKSVDQKVKILVETMNRLGIMGWDDIKDTENLYKDKLEKRKKVIKELLGKDYSVKEYLQAIDEDPKAPGYERMSIHPVKDLNLNPYEVGFYLKEFFPNKSKEEYLKLGGPWDLNEKHLHFPKEKQ
jgi:hypothetical protein